MLLVSLAFLCTTGFLALHALATPGVLLAGKNAGFQIASPIGLFLAAGFSAASGLPISQEVARMLVRRRRFFHAALAALMAAWAVVSLGTLPPLDDPVTPEGARDPLVAGSIAGVLLYGYAAVRYGRLYRRRPAPLVLALVTAFVLLAEAMFAAALARNWHLTWWEWHLLGLTAVVLVARTAWEEWKREGSTAEIFADLYEERTRGAREDVSVLFADLQGYTSYSERVGAEATKAMLDEYFGAARPIAHAYRGELNKTIGDAVFVIFREEDHPRRAAAMALAFQRRMADLSAEHPDWPRFRVGVNSGEAVLGVNVAREWTATGDTVNLAARLEKQARVGEVVIGEATYEALGEAATAEELEPLAVKGKSAPVRAYVLRSLTTDGGERENRLQGEEPKAER